MEMIGEAERIRRRRPAAPWTAETVAQIRAWAAEGLTKVQMAARLSLSLTTFKNRARGLRLEYTEDRERAVLARGAVVLRQYYETEMPTPELLALYCAAAGFQRSSKKMGEHAFRLNLHRPASVLRVKHLAANAVKAEVTRAARVQAAARLQLRLDAGLSLTAAAQEAGHGATIIAKMRAEGLLRYAGRKRRKAKAPQVKARPVAPVIAMSRPVLDRIISADAGKLVIATESPGAEPALPVAIDGVVYASFQEIQAWAAWFGIAYDGGNGDRVNKLRAARGLPRVVQDEARAA